MNEGNWLAKDRRSVVGLSLPIAALFLFAAMAGVDAHEPQRKDRVERFVLQVSNLERALRFYEIVFDLDVVERLGHPSMNTASIGNIKQLRVEEVLLRRGDEFYLGLLEFEDEVGHFRAGSLWLFTDQIDRTAADAKTLGLSVSDQTRVTNSAGEQVRRRLIEDWDGNQIYVQQRIPVDVLSGECLEIGDLESWVVFSDRHIFISGTVADSNYLLTMKTHCRGALYALRLSVPNSSGVMCSDNARLAYLDAGLRRTCRVKKIEEVLSADDAERKVAEYLENE